MQFPEGRRFAFTVFDDTDNGTVANLTPVYDLLHRCGIYTTKSVWVYPPRGRFQGQSLLDKAYLDFILQLRDRGFEIALHGVGDGEFSRQETIAGLEIFRRKIGQYPRIHTNHATNPGSIYWDEQRFTFPISALYRMAGRLARPTGAQRGHSLGSVPGSPHFWGDVAKQQITYMRNLVFNDINTLEQDPRMPYRVDSKAEYSNLWFSSSDGHTVQEMTDLLTSKNLDRLEQQGGACIVYTHFASGFVGSDGEVRPGFRKAIEDLARRNAWCVPVGTLLDHLRAAHETDADPGYWYRLGLDLLWLVDRLRKKLHYGR